MSRNNFRNKRQNSGGRKPFYNRNKGRNPKTTSKETARRKTLDDHACHVGSATKQASDYVTTTNYLVNCVRRTYTKGEDIANSLENLEEISVDKDEPQMNHHGISRGIPMRQTT